MITRRLSYRAHQEIAGHWLPENRTGVALGRLLCALGWHSPGCRGRLDCARRRGMLPK